MKSTIKISIAFAIALFLNFQTKAQVKMGNNPTTLNTNAELELESTNRGLLLPRLPLLATTNPSPLTAHVAGMVVYNTATAGDVVPAYYYNDGTKWVQIAAAGAGDFWALKGNSGTTPPTTVGTAVGTNNFWGTKDAQNLAVGVDGKTRMIFDQKGNAWGGGTGNVMASDSSSFMWGSNNKIYGFNSMVVGFANVDSSRYSIVFGNGNTLGTGGGRTNRGTILGGGGNSVTGGETYNSMINGSQNTVTGSNFESIITGFKNIVTNSQKVLVGGQDNTITAANFGTTHGAFNTVKSGYSIVQGTANNLDLLAENSALFGNSNKLYGINSLVAGTTNVDSSRNSLVFGNNNILGSGLGAVGGNNRSNRGTILGGGGNKVLGGENYNSMINGSDNTINGSNFESIITGFKNVVTNSQKILVVGQQYNLTNATFSTALGGFGSISSVYGFVHGQNNNINAGSNYGVVFGEGNTIAANHPNSMAIGKAVTTTAAAQYVSGFAGGYNLFSNVGNTVGVSLAADGTSWASISDKRSKTNIKNINYGLSTVMQLRPTMYNYKGQKNTSLGFIAQEVKEIMPEVIEQTTMGPNHDYLGIKYTEMIPVLTKAIQELKNENDALKTKNVNTEKEVASLKSQLESLSSLSAQVKELQALMGVKKSDSENSMKASKK